MFKGKCALTFARHAVLPLVRSCCEMSCTHAPLPRKRPRDAAQTHNNAYDTPAKAPRVRVVQQRQFYTTTGAGDATDPGLSFLSNYYGTKAKERRGFTLVDSTGRSWPTAEHWYQASKFMPDGPETAPVGAAGEYVELIRAAPTPNAARILGMQKKRGGYASTTRHNDVIQKYRDANVQCRPDWDVARIDVMRTVLRAKFAQNRDLRERLLQTHEDQLVEHTKRDKFWADGGGASHGQNWLGQLLMQVRSEMQA